jgi:pimeloyl-ACP methyl ester carboxylesterase
MASFALIHGGGDVGWYWHLVEAELRARGHDTVAPDLPCEDDAAGFDVYADTVVDAIGSRGEVALVGQSLGAFTATLVASRLSARSLVLVAGMIPVPGERGEDWFADTGWREAVDEQSGRDGGLTGNPDPLVAFYHDVPRPLAEEAMRRGRSQSDTPGRDPWPLEAWPNVPTRFVVCTQDRFLPPGFMRRVVSERLGIVPDEIDAGHCVALSRPEALGGFLHACVAV